MLRQPRWYALAIIAAIALANGALSDDGSVAETISIVAGGVFAFAAGLSWKR